MPSLLPQVCVCYLLNTDPAGITRVLLGRKKLGLGEGKYVGPGGKLEPGESASDAIVREVAEEVELRVDPAQLEQRGSLRYHFPSRPSWSQESTVFVCRGWSGVPSASDELDPEWFSVSDVPFARMWDDARFWLPGVLAGGTVDREFTFGADLTHVIDDGDGA